MFHKIEAINKIRKLKLNIHNTVITDDLDELDKTVKCYNYMCSIRTDREKGVTKELPFYLISCIDDYIKIKDKLKLNKQDSMIFIISNGHQYDDKLRYNLVVSFDKSGEFVLEYNATNVPLRHMYRYPDDMVYVEGNINETVASLRVANKEHNKINVREVGEIIASIYLDIYNKGLWDRNLEVSVYSEDCGELNKEYVYWEI